ncbi:MAG TPA: hypothetical protein VIJ68_01410 [Candidatus Saccharimonadales bacterium]
MKKFLLAGVLVAALITGASIFLTSHYLNSQSSKTKPAPVAACTVHGQHHVAKFQNSKLEPVHTQARACDTLTIINQDDTIRLIAFGPHDHHTPYDGITAKQVEKGQSVTIVLNQIGTFGFHDHYHDELVGSFTVTN